MLPPSAAVLAATPNRLPTSAPWPEVTPECAPVAGYRTAPLKYVVRGQRAPPPFRHRSPRRRAGRRFRRCADLHIELVRLSPPQDEFPVYKKGRLSRIKRGPANLRAK